MGHRELDTTELLSLLFFTIRYFKYLIVQIIKHIQVPKEQLPEYSGMYNAQT